MDAQDRLEQQAKLDVEEIQEWVDALDGVLKRDGVAGATQLLRTLSAELTKPVLVCPIPYPPLIEIPFLPRKRPSCPAIYLWSGVFAV